MKGRIVPAVAEKVKEMSAGICEEAESRKNMLPKSQADIMVLLPTYFIAMEGDQLVGTCGLKIWSIGQGEIISLLTWEGFRGRGYATGLIEATIKKGRKLGLREFFVLAVSPDFFRRFGFASVDYRVFPVKLWSDCAHCKRNAAGPGDKECKKTMLHLSLR
ncbi:MAG: GNAT family N-acetyltransferase [Patescibacteria group bacterium]|nr:GNAT family N-acetyltransferase [Patescibacteria group bacterium]MDD4611162.1 GNAT family N-acetyltransferase [Patescibacteria group bacterium]